MVVKIYRMWNWHAPGAGNRISIASCVRRAMQIDPMEALHYE